jgi:predicted transposase YbfD/YdcC
MAGAREPKSIAGWAAINETFLLNELDLSNGIPRQDVFRRVLMALRPAALHARLENWLSSLSVETATGVDHADRMKAFKMAPPQRHPLNGLVPLPPVSVWATEFGLSMGHATCAEELTESSVISHVLDLVDMKRAILTTVAPGARHPTAAQIIDSEADYVMALNERQVWLRQAVIDYVDEKLGGDLNTACAHLPFDNEHWCESMRINEKRHGHEVLLTVVQIPASHSLNGRAHWKRLKSIGLVTCQCRRDQNRIFEPRYYVSSLDMGVKRFARAVRGDGDIAKPCHPVLDVTYFEDALGARQRALGRISVGCFPSLRHSSTGIVSVYASRGNVVMLLAPRIF